MAESCTPDGHEDKSDAVKVAPDAPDAPASPASSSDRGSLSSSNKVQPPADLRDDEKASVHRIVDHGQHEPSRDVDGRYGEKTGEDGGPGADPGADPEQPVQRRAASRASSSRSRAVTVVARSHRRGLLGRFCLLPEVTRPYDYDRRTKWFITFLVALAAGAAPVGSSIFYRT